MELPPAGQHIVDTFRMAGAITTGIVAVSGVAMLTIDAARASLAAERLERRQKLYGKTKKNQETTETDRDDVEKDDSKSD